MRITNRNRTDHISRRGFSLPEVLVSVGLMAFVATAAIGGLVVIVRAREIIDRQNKAEMIMFATVSYLRSDLECCTNPCDMDCSTPYYPLENNNANSGFGPVLYELDTSTSRYIDIIIRDTSYNTIGIMTGESPKVQYWNAIDASKNAKYFGICVGIKYDKINSIPGVAGPEKNRKYIIAQNVIENSGMYSIIGGYEGDVEGDEYLPGKINFDEETMMFYFTVDVIDQSTGEVILSQKVNVCPDALMPNIPYNP